MIPGTQRWWHRKRAKRAYNLERKRTHIFRSRILRGLEEYRQRQPLPPAVAPVPQKPSVWSRAASFFRRLAR
jgi:hypothetical protein